MQYSSDHTVVPGATFCCTIGSSAAAEQSGTAQTMPKAGLIDVSTIPNTQYGLDHNGSVEEIIICMHYRFVSKSDSSIWTTITGPPSYIGVRRSLVEHTWGLWAPESRTISVRLVLHAIFMGPNSNGKSSAGKEDSSLAKKI